MNTQRFLFTLLSVLFLTATTMQANSISTSGKIIIRLAKDGSDALNLQLVNLQKEQTRVCITDLTGKVWFSEYIRRSNSYSKKLILNQLPYGEYLLFVEHPTESYKQAMLFTRSGIAFFEQVTGSIVEKEESANAHKVSLPGSDVILHVTTPDTYALGVQLANLPGEAVQIQISALNSLSVYRETFENEQSYAKRLYLKGLVEGSYYLTVSTKDFTEVCFFEMTNSGLELGTRQRLIKAKLTRVDFAGY